jgi:hypothetical protein
MKSFLEKYWLLSIPIVIILFILANHLSERKTEKVISESELLIALSTQKNEIESKYTNMLLDSSRIIQEKNKVISEGLKPIIIIKERKSKNLVQKVRNDSNTTSLCDSALNSQEDLIFDLDSKLYYDSIQLSECEIQNNILYLNNQKKDTIIIGLNIINNKQTKELKRKNNWFNRNKLYIGSFLGALFTLLTIK